MPDQPSPGQIVLAGALQGGQIPLPSAPPPDQSWDQITGDPRYQSADPKLQLQILRDYRDAAAPHALYQSTVSGGDPEEAEHHINSWYQGEMDKIRNPPQNPIQFGQNVGRAFNAAVAASIPETVGGLERQAGAYIQETPNLDLQNMDSKGLGQEKVNLQNSIKDLAPKLAALQTEASYAGGDKRILGKWGRQPHRPDP